MVAVLAAVAVGVVLLVAGGAKIAAGPAWPEQAAGLGVSTPLALVVPWVEIIVGALLCAQLARTALALVAAGMVTAFTALLVVHLGRGQHPPCACFGSWSAKPLRWSNVVRNLVIICLALIAAWA